MNDRSTDIETASVNFTTLSSNLLLSLGGLKSNTDL